MHTVKSKVGSKSNKIESKQVNTRKIRAYNINVYSTQFKILVNISYII